MALPSGWYNQDIGTYTPAGSATSGNGAFTLTSTNSSGPSGTNADTFQFVFQPLAGVDFSIVVRYSLDPGDGNGATSPASWGLMVRGALDNSAQSVAIYNNGIGQGNNNINFGSRLSDGNTWNHSTVGTTPSTPYYLKLTYSASTNTVIGFQSIDGVTWSQMGSQVTVFPSTSVIYVGMFLANKSVINTSQIFDKVVVTGSPSVLSGGGTIAGAPGSTAGQYNSTNRTNQGASNVSANQGSTSGVSGYTLDILQIIQEAAERASVDFTGAYTLRSAKRSLDLLSMEWANEGLNLWTLDFQTIALVAGTPSYTLPADTMDLLYPSLRTTQGGQQIDIAMGREDFASYASIPNKLQQGRPTVIFIQRLAIPVAFVWQVPDSVTPYTLAYWRLRRMQNTGYATNTLDLPFRFIPAVIAGLAYHLAMKKPIKDLNLITGLKAVYDESFMKAKYEDRDRSSIFIVPYFGY